PLFPKFASSVLHLVANFGNGALGLDAYYFKPKVIRCPWIGTNSLCSVQRPDGRRQARVDRRSARWLSALLPGKSRICGSARERFSAVRAFWRSRRPCFSQASPTLAVIKGRRSLT